MFHRKLALVLLTPIFFLAVAKLTYFFLMHFGISYRPHRMHEMRTIATDDPVAWCVCLSVTRLRPAKAADQAPVLWRSWGGAQGTLYQTSIPICLTDSIIRCGLRQINFTICL